MSYFQDAPLDGGNFYTGDTLNYGLFHQTGMRWPNYYAFTAFANLLDTPARVQTTGEDMESGLAICAGRATDDSRAHVLLSNCQSVASRCEVALTHLPWTGRTRCETYLLDATHQLELVQVEYHHGAEVILHEMLPAPTVCLF